MTVRQLTFRGFFLAVSLILSYVEAVIPVAPSIPGVKLGLANLAVLLLLYHDSGSAAFSVNMARVLLTGILFGNMTSVLYALAGAVCSFLVMLLLKKTALFTPVGVSAAGGLCHNAAQLAVAAVVLQSRYVFGYLPYLAAAGVLTGIFNGIVAERVGALGFMEKIKL